MSEVAVTPDADVGSHDDGRLTDQDPIEEVLLGGKRKYTRSEVAELTGVSLDRVQKRWRALGFASVDDDAVVFTDADVEAARTAEELFGSGLIEAGMDAAMTRALGHHLSRLAEWQASLVTEWLSQQPELAEDPQAVTNVVQATLPVIQRLQTYVWRRHLAAYALRASGRPDEQTVTSDQVVGFVDMVGYTRMTRQIDEDRLGAVLERFEQIASDAIAERHGRIVKTIGDEVLFVTDNPADSVDIAVALNAAADTDPDMPMLRSGLAYGHVLNRLGDVYGSVVNIAARLTSVARPGTILVDEQLAAELAGSPEYELRSLRPVSVRGYRKLRAFAVRSAQRPGTG